MYFITGNKNKFIEAKKFIPELEQLDIDLVEIQELDPRVIIRHKLDEARKVKTGEFIVEDTSFYIEGLNDLPGPLIKWFLQSLGRDGLADLAIKSGHVHARVVAIIGYSDEDGKIEYFEGEAKGKIVEPRGETKFGWDPIFMPEGYDRTFAEMGVEEKNKISHRRKAFEKLAFQLKIKN
jgi:non-canonical purine NTP pyrophosphatase (RdgB/HAM1 family)